MMMLVLMVMMISVIEFELLNGFDTNVNEGGVYGDNNNDCGDGDFDDLILLVLIPVNTLKINIHISFS